MLIYLLCLANFFCLAFYIENTPILFCLAILGILSFFLPEKTRPTATVFLFLAFYLYFSLCDIFLFPDTSGTVMYRKMLYSFFSGLAVFYCLRQKTTDITLQLGLLLLCMAIYCAVATAIQGDSSPFFHRQRLELLFNHPNGLGMATGISVISACYYLLFRPGQKKSREEPLKFIAATQRLLHNPFTLVTIAIFSFAILIWTQSRTSLFACLAVCGLLLFSFAYTRISKTQMALLVLTIAVLTAGSVAILPKQGTIGRMTSALRAPLQDPTFRSRMPGWESALYAFALNPVTGNGPESFCDTHKLYLKENYARLVQELGEATVKGDTVKLPHAHNQYLMLLAEGGAAGFALLLLLLLFPIYTGLRQRSAFGITLPVLAFLMLLCVFEAPFYGAKAASISNTIIFMLLGYFAGIQGGSPCNESSRDKNTVLPE